MAIVAGATIYGLFCCCIIFPIAGLPAYMHRLAMALAAAELVALGVWSYGSADCVRRPCGALAETARTAAMLDIPLFGVALVGVAVIGHRRLTRRPARAPARASRRRRRTPRPRRASPRRAARR